MLTSCSQSIPNSITTSWTTTSSLPTISIVSGSENKELEPLIQRFAQKKGYDISMTYKGSLDIFQDLNDNSTSVDAIWPASSIWENLLSNTNVKLSHSESIFKTPVVFAIKNDKAQELGLIWKEIWIYDILKLITTGQLSFAMTNATQSNSWFSAFLSFLVGFSNKQDSTLTVDDLNKVTTLDQTRKLLKGVNRSSGSSNWLKDLFLSKYDSLDAMVNYESLVIDTNKELEKEGKSPLYMFYIKEGIVLSNSPLSYVDNGNTEKEKVFLELQQYLLSKDVQDEIQNLGRRTGLSLNSTLDRTIYKPEWGVKDDLTKTKQILFPSKDTFNKMLEVYLLSLKKPSYTVYVVDTSGSMEWNGLDQLKSGLKTIFNQSLAKKYFLQASPNDSQ